MVLQHPVQLLSLLVGLLSDEGLSNRGVHLGLLLSESLFFGAAEVSDESSPWGPLTCPPLQPGLRLVYQRLGCNRRPVCRLILVEDICILGCTRPLLALVQFRHDLQLFEVDGFFFVGVNIGVFPGCPPESRTQVLTGQVTLLVGVFARDRSAWFTCLGVTTLAVGGGVEGRRRGSGLFAVEKGSVILSVQLGDVLIDLNGLGKAATPPRLQFLDLFLHQLQLRLLQSQYLPRLRTVLLPNVSMLDEEVVFLNALLHHLNCCTPHLFLPFPQPLFRLLSQQPQLPIVLHHQQLLLHSLQLPRLGHGFAVAQRLDVGYFLASGQPGPGWDVLLGSDRVAPTVSKSGLELVVLPQQPAVGQLHRD